MCLAIPAEIISIDQQNDTAIASVAGVKKEISLALVQDVVVGDYVLIHVGYALNRIDPDEAQKTLQLFAEAGMV